MYYNDELKKRFIDSRSLEVTLPNNYLHRQFMKVAVVENRLQKDISSFSYYEIIDYYKMLNTTSEMYLRVLNSQFSLYTSWCLNQNLVPDGQNHFLELRCEDYFRCINKLKKDLSVISREELMIMIDSLPNPKDQFILLCLFEGIKGKDFCEITLLKVTDFNGNMVTLESGKIIQISDELVDIKDKALETDIYYSMTGYQKKEIPLIDHGFIIKEYPNVEFDQNNYARGRRIYNQIKRIFAYLGVEYLKANDIFTSGMICMIKENAKQRGMSSKEYLYSPYIYEVEQIFGEITYKKNFLQKYEDCL